MFGSMNTSNEHIHEKQDSQSKKAHVFQNPWTLACVSTVDPFSEGQVFMSNTYNKRQIYDGANIPTWQQHLLEAP